MRFAFLLLLCVAALIPLSHVEAVSMGKITVSGPKAETNKGYAIGIVLSDTCIASVKAGSKACPSYHDLVSFDNSIPAYSGSFKDVNGFYQRVPTKYPNSMGFYQYDPTFRVFVDPIKTAKIPLVTIETQIPEYHAADQRKIQEIKNGDLVDSKAIQSSRLYSVDRYVDPTCSYASISAKSWKTLLPDTIDFMKHDCDPNYTNVQTVKNDVKTITVHDVATSNKYKLDRFYQTAIKDCTKSYQSCKTIPNKAVTTKSDTR